MRLSSASNPRGISSSSHNVNKSFSQQNGSGVNFKMGTTSGQENRRPLMQQRMFIVKDNKGISGQPQTSSMGPASRVVNGQINQTSQGKYTSFISGNSKQKPSQSASAGIGVGGKRPVPLALNSTKGSHVVRLPNQNTVSAAPPSHPPVLATCGAKSLDSTQNYIMDQNAKGSNGF